MNQEISHATTYAIRGYEGDSRVLEQLRNLRPERYPLVKEIHFVNIAWSVAIVNECDIAFESYTGFPRWGWLAVYGIVDQGNDFSLHLRSVIDCAIRRNRSSSYLFSGTQSESSTTKMDQHVATAISCVMNEVVDLDAIRIDSFCIPNASMFQIAQNLASRRQPHRPSRLVLRDVHFVESYGQPYNGASDILATGFAGNSSLIELELFQSRVDDTRMTRLLSSLVGHPMLRQLNIGQTILGTKSLEMLHRLILSGQLSGLRFVATIDSGNPLTNLENLVAHIPPNPFLKRLEFSFNYVPSPTGEEDVRLVLENLPKWPNLVALNMEFHSLNSPERMLSELSPTSTTIGHLKSCSQLRRLYLDLNQPDDFASYTCSQPLVMTMLHVLRVFPRLGYLGRSQEERVLERYSKGDPACIRHRMDMNRCGLDLLQGASLPLSVWPLILARTQKDDVVPTMITNVSYQANAIYHLLQSPNFFQLFFDLPTCCTSARRDEYMY